MAGSADDDDYERDCLICFENSPDVRMTCGHNLCKTCCVAEIVRINTGGDAAAHALEVRCFMCSQSGVSFRTGDADVTEQILELAAARLAPAAPLHAQADQVVVRTEQGSPEEDSGWSVVPSRARQEQSAWQQPVTARLDDFSVVPASRGARFLEVRLREDGRCLTDADFQHLAPAIAAAVENAVVELDWARPVALDFRLVNHRCGNVGMAALCDACLGPLLQGGWAYCHFLRAWSNEIGDDGCRALAEHLGLQGRARATHMRELHLSDNQISFVGALALVSSSLKIYPRVDEWGRQRLPLWLRLHRNAIDTAAFFDQVDNVAYGCCITPNP